MCGSTQKKRFQHIDQHLNPSLKEKHFQYQGQRGHIDTVADKDLRVQNIFKYTLSSMEMIYSFMFQISYLCYLKKFIWRLSHHGDNQRKQQLNELNLVKNSSNNNVSSFQSHARCLSSWLLSRQGQKVQIIYSYYYKLQIIQMIFNLNLFLTDNFVPYNSHFVVFCKNRKYKQQVKKQQSKMSRSVPWRNKPTPLITQMIPVAAQMKLYLVNQIGPTSFMFKDENENKFKVVIGSKISCSCGVVDNDHCIHTLYVMLKKYKVPQTQPILWQASYLDSQLEGLIQFKYMEKKKKQNTNNFKSKKKAHLMAQSQNNEDFPPLDQDQTCPICYEDMVGQCYSSCGTCRKSIHTKCLKVWVRHKQDHGQNVTCPMCRSQFHNPMGMVMSDLQKWEKRFTIHKGTTCKTCGVKNIKGLIYKCLLCPNSDLCKYCYEGNQHLDHDKFFVKELSNENWKIAPIRVRKSRQQLFQLIKQIQTRDLPSDIGSPEFIMSIFPTIKEHNGMQGSNQLGIVGNQMLMKQICYKCRTIGDESMKRLNCGHSVHATCLRIMIEKQDYLCEVDQEPICPGYLSALGIKVKPNKKAVMADVGFIRAEQQSNRIKQKLGSDPLGYGLGVKVQRMNERTKQSSVNKHNAKSKDRNFRIMKKNIIQRRTQLDQLGVGVGFGSPMMITGLTHGSNMSNNFNGLMPKPPSQGGRNRTLPRPL